MRLAGYTLGPAGLAMLGRFLASTASARIRGFPRLPGDTPAEIAHATLRHNARGVLRAGAGHYHVMWVADTGLAFAGAQRALSRAYLAGLVSRMVRESARARRVPTCFDAAGHFDAPWPRADGAPWLLHMVALLDDDAFVAEHTADLDRIYADWFEAHVDARTGLVRESVTGDWMDTVPRPSSTYNNALAMRAFEVAAKLGLERAPVLRAEAEAALLQDRWTGTHLRDHARAGDYVSADANVLPLYFGLLPEANRRRIAEAIERAGLCSPVPMRTREGDYRRQEAPPAAGLAPGYHSATWAHLGLLYCNGRRRVGLAVDEHVAAVERTVVEHGTFLETLDAEGRPWRSRLLVTEHAFTAAAGLYLELAGVDGRPP